MGFDRSIVTSHGGAGAGENAGRAAGGSLAGVIATIGRLRPADKPLHPRGQVSPGQLHRFGLADPCGVPWLDEPGTDEVTVRLSRAIGLPAPLPDVLGLALRLRLDSGDADLLFASTGHGRVSRFLLEPRLHTANATFSTLLPYRAPAGPVVLAAAPAPLGASLRFDLRAATGLGRWRTFASLEVLQARREQDAEIDFDPMLNRVPGLEPYDWVKRLREPSYRVARRSREART